MEDATKCADSNCHRQNTDDSRKNSQIKPAGLKQQSLYDKSDRPVPDNNPFFTERSNPLSSKGN